MQVQRPGISGLQRVPLLVSAALSRAQPNLLTTQLHRGERWQPAHTGRAGVRTKPRYLPAVAAATGQVSPAFTWVATGVPLVEKLQSLSLTQAAIRSAALVAATVLAVMAGQKLLILCEEKVRQRSSLACIPWRWCCRVWRGSAQRWQESCEDSFEDAQLGCLWRARTCRPLFTLHKGECKACSRARDSSACR